MSQEKCHKDLVQLFTRSVGLLSLFSSSSIGNCFANLHTLAFESSNVPKSPKPSLQQDQLNRKVKKIALPVFWFCQILKYAGQCQVALKT
jgi:hypothetical protein